MTAKELYHILRKAIENGQGDWEILLPDYKIERIDIADVEIDEDNREFNLVPKTN